METPISINTIIFIVLLIVPGVFFKRFYFQGEFTKQFGAGVFADRLITSIFWGLFVQVITFLLFSRALNFSYDTIKGPVSKTYAQLASNNIPDFTSFNLWMLLAYMCVSIAVPVVLGTFCHKLVRAFKIDTKFLVFRFANQWNYYFRGDILASNDFKSSKTGKVLSTSIDIIMDGGTDKPKMFSGLLSQYDISAKSGDLETLFLTNAKRWSESTKSFKSIPGDIVIIPYNRVIDMNVSYSVKVVNHARRKAITDLVANAVIYLTLLSIITWPWFFHLSIIRTLVGIVDSLVAFLLLLILITDALTPSKQRILKTKATLVSIILFLICLGVSIQIMWLPAWKIWH